MIGKTVSHYKILEKLGEGGMGVVYKAEDTALKRTVALKFLPPELTREGEAKERFIHEAQAASSLEHTNICNIHEINETENGQLFIVMACYEGESLRDQIERGPLILERALDIAIQIASGLTKAHEKGIVHRDIKSANVFITDDGVVKILDFGLAKLGDRTKLTREQSILGTVTHMSPEQVRSENVDPRSDIWSLGVVLYEMLTGQLPFKGDYEQAVIYSILNESPKPVTAIRSGIPIELDRIIGKALVKEPSERYQHVDEMIVDLKTIHDKPDAVTTKSSRSKQSKSKKRLLFLYAGIVIILLAVLVGRYFLTRTPKNVIDSIAVLPLENLTGDDTKRYIVDGIHEALITELYKIKALKVISRQSVKQYRNTTKSAPQIADELKIKGLVEGSVQLIEDQVIITVQLIDARWDHHLWANNYEGNFRDILFLQKHVTRAIAGEIKVQVTPQDEERLGAPRYVDPEAYKLYLKGSQVGFGPNPESYQQGIEYLERSIAKDSTFSLPYITMANLHILFGGYFPQARDDVELKARQMLAKALELDVKQPGAHVASALFKVLYEWDWDGADQAYRLAIALEPGNSDTHWQYGKFLVWMGKFESGVSEVKYAQELNPLSGIVRHSLMEVYLFSRQYDKAIEWGNSVLEVEPDSSFISEMLGWACLCKEMYVEAIEHFEIARMAFDNPFYLGELGYAYAVSGKKEQALKVLEQLRQREDSKEIWPRGGQALIYCGLGQYEQMLIWVEHLYEMRWPWLLLIKTHPMYDLLRERPRFKALLEKMALEK